MDYIHNESMRAYLLITFYCYLLLYSLILRIYLTGTPPTTVFAGTSLVTIKPAAMTALFPMVIYRINEESVLCFLFYLSNVTCTIRMKKAD